MIDNDEKLKLFEALVRTFKLAEGLAKEKAEKELSAPLPVAPLEDKLPKHKRVLKNLRDSFPVSETAPRAFSPQVCSLLLCTGAIISGMVLDTVSYDNLDMPDAVQSAGEALANTVKAIPKLKNNFKIVAVAMTTTLDHQSGELVGIDLGLYEQSLSELPNLTAPYLILVEPNTRATAYSEPFSNYKIV